MEWIGSLLLGGILLLCVLQLLWAHTISAIAEKTDQSELMQVLAWIPILQLAPTLAAGGGNIGRFLTATVAVLLGNGALIAAAAVLGGSLGSVVLTLGLGLSSLLCLFYFGLIARNTAIARDLPGWLGLLVFVPVLNFFIYPYIAFHDGWVGPNRVGLAIGSVLILGSTLPTFQAVHAFNEAGVFSADTLLTMAKGQPADRSNEREIQTRIFADRLPLGPPDPQVERHAANTLDDIDIAERQRASLRVLYQLRGRFDKLDSLVGNTSGAEDTHLAQATGIIQSLRADLDLHQSELDPATYRDLGEHLLALESRLMARPENASHVRNRASTNARDLGGQIGPAAMRMPRDSQTPSYGDQRTPPARPFPIRASESCPSGTERHEIKDAESEREWCQQLAEFGGLRHGWYAKYLEDGQPESMGQYENGLRVGVWTRFYPTGEVRAQAEFKDGMQHGWVLAFDQRGRRTRDAWYQYGSRVTAQ